MSVADWTRAAKRRRRTDHLVGLRHWTLWREPTLFVGFVLGVDLAAAAAILATVAMVPIGGRHLALFAVLAVLSGVHLELNRRIERLRELATEGITFTNFTAIWTFAGLLLLPPPLVAALIVAAYTHMWFRISARVALHRWVFTAATVVLASAGAGAILAVIYPLSYPGFPMGWFGIGVVATSAIIRWAINSGFVFGFMAIETTWRKAFKNVFQSPADDVIEFCSLSLGVLVAAALTFNPPLLLVIALPIVAAHRGVLLSQFEHAAQRDAETGALRLELWRELAIKQLERADRIEAPVGYLFARLDKVDPGLSVMADGRIGRLVADAIRSELREGDLIGRLPGGVDFAILLAGITGNDLSNVAERICRAVKAVEVNVDTATGQIVSGGLTVSIGGASYPGPAATLAELMQCADNALFLARTYVRDEVRIVGPDTPARTR